MTPGLASIGSKGEAAGDIAHINEVVSPTHVGFKAPAGKIEDKLADVGNAKVKGAYDTGGAADDSVETALTDFIEEKQRGPGLDPGIVAEDPARIKGL